MPRPVPEAWHMLSSLFLTTALEVGVDIPILQKKKLRLRDKEHTQVDRGSKKQNEAFNRLPLVTACPLSQPHQPLGPGPLPPQPVIPHVARQGRPWNGDTPPPPPSSQMALAVKG